jgi:hypothetical protein
VCLSDVRTETKRKALNSRTTDERPYMTLQPRYVRSARTAMRSYPDQYALIREQQRISTLPHVMGAGAGCAGAGRLPARPAPLYGIFYAAVV